MAGKFYGIGVGPGDPELLTLKAYRTLQEVDIVCVPKSKEEKDSLALSIVKKELSKEFGTLELLFPMSRDESVLNYHWDKAAEEIVTKLEEGHNLAFITIGDPMFYSTYAYILKRIQIQHPHIEIQTIPGVTAFSATTSWLNNPMAEADEKIAVIPAAYEIEDLKEVLLSFENVVLMKVNKKYDQIVSLLGELDLMGKAAFVSRVGHEDQSFTTDLEALVGKQKDYMSMLIVKKSGWRGL